MAFIKCPKCRRPISDQARRCPACATPVGKGATVATRPGGRSGMVVGLLVLAVAAVLGVYLKGWMSTPTIVPGTQASAQPTAPAPVDRKFGLTEDKRREVYDDFIRAEDHAAVAADYRYPPLDTLASATRWQMHADMREHFRQQVDDEDKNAIARRYGLTSEQLRAIAAEGTDKGWPRPARQSIR